jgi:glucoamylase
MPRDLPLGNGTLLVAFDADYRLRELYYPHVGQPNHVSGGICRFGVFVSGRLSWVERASGWEIRLGYEPDTLVGRVECVHRDLGVALSCTDVVDFHENLYLRRVLVKNLAPGRDRVRLFFHQNFAIDGNDIGDTAAYDPVARAVVHYKGQRYLLVNVHVAGTSGVPLWAVGQKGQPGKEGTFRDAEDGELSSNPIAQGSVDSVVGVDCVLDASGTAEAYYWIAVGPRWEGSWDSARELNTKVTRRGPVAFLDRTRAYWKLWAEQPPADFADLPDEIIALYRRSLLVLRTHADAGGAIVAATDSDIVGFARDTYCYCWPRDGALAAYALDLAGHQLPSLRFFEFCADHLTTDGYLLHKYAPDGTLGSSWHPWIAPRPAAAGDRTTFDVQLPIQEDETALVIWALWRHFEKWHDIEAMKPLYGRLVKKAARFLADYRDSATGLPCPSWDLWEERRGVATFTAGAVVGGLMSAAKFARAFGEMALAELYATAAERIRQAMAQHLFRPELGRFARRVVLGASGVETVDETVDASVYGVFAFGAFSPEDPKVVATMRAVEDRLTCKTDLGGVARYENDGYQRATNDIVGVPGNPWFVCTLWLAEHAVASARTVEDLARPRAILAWVERHALPSGVLAEQLHPLSAAPLSVSPLTWSHAGFVIAVREYVARHEAIVRGTLDGPRE